LLKKYFNSWKFIPIGNVLKEGTKEVSYFIYHQ
jgi:hypothetical protein